MRVRYTETAFAELEDIFSYIAQHNRTAAAEVVARVEALTRRLAYFPHMSRPKFKPEVRMMPVGRYPFLVFYRIEADEVVILSVRHAARKRPTEGSEFD
jgi:plasmid stabilization system protein ParE